MQKMNAGEKFDNSKSQQKGERGGKNDARFVGGSDRECNVGEEKETPPGCSLIFPRTCYSKGEEVI
jgi:hypothetical protein